MHARVIVGLQLQVHQFRSYSLQRVLPFTPLTNMISPSECFRFGSGKIKRLKATNRPAQLHLHMARQDGNQQAPISSRPTVRSNADGLDIATPSTAYMDTESQLQQLNVLRRRLKEAVAEEDYATAQQLKQQSDALKGQLPPLQQYMLVQADKLRSGSTREKRAAIKSLAEVGDDSCLAELATCLHDPELNSPTTDAMWAVFQRHHDPAVRALMDKGLALMHIGKHRAACDVFTEACKLDPGFAEAHNKHATVLYLLHEYKESIEVCKLVLQLNPYHFAAASGMGMCYLQLEDHQAALDAFERALAINPAMDPIQTYVAALRAKLADDAGR